MFIDEATIKVTSGRGGTGRVAFDKNKGAIGPVGGDGGRGGSVFLSGVSDLGALEQFRHKKEFEAENGGDGRGQFIDGKDGADLIISVPVGTVIHNETTGFDYEIISLAEKILVARGGRGGRGNFKFRSAANTSPKEFEEGQPSEKMSLRLELKLIADIGLIGLPNAGKSSLLNAITNAKPR